MVNSGRRSKRSPRALCSPSVRSSRNVLHTLVPYSITEIADTLAGNYYEYVIWRVTICRLANVDRLGRGEYIEFGQATKAYRESLIPAMVSEVLSSKTVQLLLEEPRKIKPGHDAFGQLLPIYKRVAEDTVGMSFWDLIPEIYTLMKIVASLCVISRFDTHARFVAFYGVVLQAALRRYKWFLFSCFHSHCLVVLSLFSLASTPSA